MDSGTNTLQTVFNQLIQMRRICPSYILCFLFLFLASEFLLIKYSDADRLDQILAHTSYEDHPFKCFSWGNRDTLTKVPLASLRESALDFFNTHYRASSMILVIVLGSGSGNDAFVFFSKNLFLILI